MNPKLRFQNGVGTKFLSSVQGGEKRERERGGELKLRNLIHYLKVGLAMTTKINLKCKQILNQETLYQDSTV